MKHWEFTGETTYFIRTLLHRIKATDDIVTEMGHKISSGTLGGWIEKEANLKDCAWVGDDAIVLGDAVVYDNAMVCGDAVVYDNARVYGDAMIYGNAMVYGYAVVYDNAAVYGNAMVCDNAAVYGDAMIYGNAIVYGDSGVHGDAEVYDNACIKKNTHWLNIGPFGSRSDTITFTRDKSGTIFVSRDYFFGTIDEFRKQVISTYGDNKHGRVYLTAADLAELQLDTTPIE